jgi:hypothetical protein
MDLHIEVECPIQWMRQMIGPAHSLQKLVENSQSECLAPPTTKRDHRMEAGCPMKKTQIHPFDESLI